MMNTFRVPNRLPWILILGLTVAIGGMMITGILFFDHEKETITQASYQGLSAVATMKSRQIDSWRSQIFAMGELLCNNSLAENEIGSFVRHPADSSSRRNLLEFMEALRPGMGFESIALCDLRGNRLLAVPADSIASDTSWFSAARELHPLPKPCLLDIRIDARTGKPYLDVLFPVLSRLPESDGHLFAFFAVKINPERTLFPLVQSRTASSQLSVSLLLRRDGKTVTYLNAARQHAGGRPYDVFPVDSGSVIGSIVLRGVDGTFEGLDADHRDVFASVKAIPNTPWFLVVKIASDEVYSSLRVQAWTVGIVLALLIMLAGAIMMIWWRNQRSHFFKEQYEAEVQRRALIEHFAYLVKYANDIILLANEHLAIIEANDRALDAYGYSAEEMTGMNLSQLSPALKMAFPAHELPDPGQRGRTYVTNHRRKNGTTFPVEVSDRLIAIDGKKFYQAIIRDIAERKLAEAAMRESENRFRVLSEASSEGVVITSHGIVIDANKTMAIMLGYTVEEMIGKNVAAFVAPESLDQVAARLARQSEESYEHWALRKDGTKFLVEARARVIPSAKGVLRITTIRDLTEQRRTHESLLRLNKAVQASGEVIFMTDREGTINFVNEGFSRLYGYSPDEVIGKTTPRILKSGVMAAEQYEQFWQSLLSGQRFQGEMANRTKDGHLVHVDVSANPIVDDTGMITGFLAVQRDISERKRDAANLEDALTLNKTMMNASPIGIVAFRDTGELISVNKAASDIIGVPMEQLFRQNFRQLSSWRDSILLMTAEEVLRSKIGQDIDTEVFSTGGKRVWMRGRLDCFQYQGQLHLLFIFTDETYRRRADKIQEVVYRVAQEAGIAQKLEDLFRSIRSLLAALINTNNFFIALYDKENDLITFPYFVDEVDDNFPPRKPGKGLTEYVLQTGKALLCTERIFKEMVVRGEAELVGEPSPIWLGVPLIGGKNVIGAMVVQDYHNPEAYGENEKEIMEYMALQIGRVIDRKRAEEELALQKSYFQQLFEESPAGIAMLDAQSRVVNINKTFQKMFQYTIAEIRGKNINSCLAGEEYGEEAHRISQSIQQGIFVTTETARKRKDGAIVSVRVTGYPIVVNGAHAGAYAIYEDISERRRLESQILHSQKMESLGTLAGGIAHDFNNILGIIMGHASVLIRRQVEPQKILNSAGVIAKAAERGASLVRQLLTFARKTETTFESARINDIIRELVHLLNETFPKTIVISTTLEKNLPSTPGDTTQLHQVLLNICVNARDAMPSGGTLQITTGVAPNDAVREKFPDPGAQSYIVIQIADTGIGMDEETRSRIFEPFFTTKGRGKGTGLGMALVYGIIEHHQGYIDVETAPGQGTTFTIYLPVQPTTSVGEMDDAKLDEAPGGTETILVVEDEPMLRDLLQSALEQKGYAVLTAADGEEAVHVYLKNDRRIALIVSDVGLPKMSGVQVHATIKEICPDVRFILASGYLEPDQKRGILAAGVKEFIQKPYEFDEILRTIRKVLDQK